VATTLSGDAGNDTITGTLGGDTISGGTGSDVINGRGGKDIMTGGEGPDRFNFNTTESNVTAGLGDQITDWSSEDTISFNLLGAATGTTYVETVSSDYASALGIASNAIAGGTIDFVLVQIGVDLVLFADSNNDNGTADTGVVILGKTLADIDFTNVISGL
jgi:Ca2+-binding RTX toxin-like protein